VCVCRQSTPQDCILFQSPCPCQRSFLYLPDADMPLESLVFSTNPILYYKALCICEVSVFSMPHLFRGFCTRPILRLGERRVYCRGAMVRPQRTDKKPSSLCTRLPHRDTQMCVPFLAHRCTTRPRHASVGRSPLFPASLASNDPTPPFFVFWAQPTSERGIQT